MINKVCSVCGKEKIILSDLLSICEKCKGVKNQEGLLQFVKESYNSVTAFINNNEAILRPLYEKSIISDAHIVQALGMFNYNSDFIKRNNFDLSKIPNDILYEYCKAVYEIKKYGSEGKLR